MKEMAKSACWRERITSFTGKDLLRCPICQTETKLVEAAYFSRRLGSFDFYHAPQLSLLTDPSDQRANACLKGVDQIPILAT